MIRDQHSWQFSEKSYRTTSSDPLPDLVVVIYYYQSRQWATACDPWPSSDPWPIVVKTTNLILVTTFLLHISSTKYLTHQMMQKCRQFTNACSLFLYPFNQFPPPKSQYILCRCDANLYSLTHSWTSSFSGNNKSETLFSVVITCSVAKPAAESNTLAKHSAKLRHLHTPKYQTVPQ